MALKACLTRQDATVGANPAQQRKKSSKMFTRNIVLAVHPEHVPRLGAIENEDYSGVVRKVREFYTNEHGHEPTQEYMGAGIEGLKQYYAVALLDPLNAHAVSAKIDLFWHAHILHSQLYAAFCDRVVGQFMHHIPLDDSNAEAVRDVRRLYGYTLEVLPKLFNNVQANNWPQEGDTDYRLLCSHNRIDMASAVTPHALFCEDPRGIPLVH